MKKQLLIPSNKNCFLRENIKSFFRKTKPIKTLMLLLTFFSVFILQGQQLSVVKDINNGTGSSSPQNLITLNNKIYFTASTTTSGLELWETDGTEAGTKLLKDINAGANGSNPSHLTVFNNKIYFSADDGINGNELWVSDGTEAGTQLFKDVNANGAGSSSTLRNVTVGATKFYFVANDGAHGYELWVSDGTEAGTKLVKDLSPGNSGFGPNHSNPENLTTFNDKVYFSGPNGNLWVSDGSEAGTIKLKDVNLDKTGKESLVVFNNKLYFKGNDGTNGSELWESDGTESGTKQVKDINPGTGGSNPVNLTVCNDKLYFSANDGVNGYEIWLTDGTEAGTKLVKVTHSMPIHWVQEHLTSFNNKLYYTNYTALNGKELWVTDGTESGTMLLKDISMGVANSLPEKLMVFKDKLYFNITNQNTKKELWETDGTVVGTKLVKAIETAYYFDFSRNPNSGHEVIDIAVLKDNFYFRAFNTTVGDELFSLSFTSAPEVTTVDASAVTTTSTTLEGNITSNGGASITERGFVYALTTEDATPTLAEAGNGKVIKVVENGATGAYNKKITDLTSNTSYSYAAYAINSIGSKEGEVKTVTTQQKPFITVWKTTTANENIQLQLSNSYVYDYTIDWGDGTTSNETGSVNHTYTNPGTYTVKIAGKFPAVSFENSGLRNKIIDVQQWGDIKWKSFNRTFYQCENLNITATDTPDLKEVTDLTAMFFGAKKFNGDISSWDVSTITSMSEMFAGAVAFNQDISSWNVANVTNMESMFASKGQVSFKTTNSVTSSVFNQDLSSWDVSKVTNMSNMFKGATAFNSPLNWGTKTSKVANMASMFEGATAFNQDISSWDVSSVTSMSKMFKDATAFNSPLNWNTKTSKVISMTWMFEGATSFNQDISGWDVSKVTNISSMFSGATSFNQNISGWNVSSAIYLSSMFYNATAFNQDISGWNVNNVTTMSGMFRGATSFNQDLSAWANKMSKVTSIAQMFYGATSFNQDISNWNVENITSMSFIFQDATGFSSKNYDKLLNAWSQQNVQNNVEFGGYGIYYCNGEVGRNSLKAKGWTITDSGKKCPKPFITVWKTTTANESITIPVNTKYAYNYTVDWGDGTITNEQAEGDAMHSYATAGNYTIKITGDFPAIYFVNKGDKEKIINIQQWGDIEWKSFDSAFHGCINLNSTATDAPNLTNVTRMDGIFLNASSFNGNVSNWDVSNVTNMANMFLNATVFNQDLSNWNVKNVTTMSHMFQGASKFNQDLSNWNVGKVEDFWGMFLEAKSFNGNLSNWNIGEHIGEGKFINMQAMFSIASSFNQPLTNWDLSKVNNTSWMFNSASSFNQNLSNWNVSNVTNMSRMFLDAVKFNSDVSNWNVSKVINMHGMFAANQGKIATFNQDLSKWNVSNVELISSMFYNNSEFNQDISGWDVSNVTNMSQMFWEASAFDQDLSSWDVGSVTNMSGMFGAFDSRTVFNQDISNWNVSNVTNMSLMFQYNIKFNQDLSKWGNKTSKVTNMNFMFAGAEMFNQDLSDWDVSNVEGMEELFWGSKVFNQDLSNWDIRKVKNMKLMFHNSLLSIENYDKLLNAWSKQEVQSNVVFGAEGIHFCEGTEGKNALVSKGWVITDAGKDCPPMLVSTTPENKATNIALDTNIEFIFDEAIKRGTVITDQIGNIILSKATDEEAKAIAIDISITATKLIINPKENLEPNTQYFLAIQKGAITDLKGNNGKQLTKFFTTVNKLTPTITFNSFEKTYGDDVVMLNATSNSSATISYAIVGEARGASITENKLTLGNVGTITVKATVKENSTHFSALKEATVKINKAVLIATAENKSKVYGDSNPVFTINYSGFKNGDTVKDLTTKPAVNSTATKTTNVGTVAITISEGVSANYAIKTVPGNLTINKANLTAKADNKERMYGEVNPVFTINYTGFKNGEDVDAIDSKPLINTNANSTSNVGTYDINLTDGNDNNYAILTEKGTLNIVKRGIEITADLGQNKISGATDPTFTYQITSGSLVGSDSFSGELTREAGELTGTYNILIGTLTLGNNYDLSFISNPFRIDLVVTTGHISRSSKSVIVTGVVGAGIGVVERGVVYSSVDTTPELGEANVIKVADDTTTGPFVVEVYGLNPNTTYYYQSYIITKVAKSTNTPTVYGGIKSFTTLAIEPNIVSKLPMNSALKVTPDTNLTLNFDTNVQKGTGNILIKKSADNSIVETIDVTNANVNITGNTVTINPTVDLPQKTALYVEIPIGAIEDTSSNSWTGFGASTDWNFTTDDTVAPTLIGLSPSNNTVNVTPRVNFMMTFSEDIKKGAGSILVKKVADDSTVGSLDVTSAMVSIAGNIVTIDPSMDMPSETALYIEVPATAFLDLYDNAYVGFVDKTTWSFTTADITKPTVSITSTASNPTNAPFTATVTFSEDVSNFEMADITVANATVSNFVATSASVYTALITPTADGNVTIDVAADVANDAATNTNTAATQFSILYDTVKPTVAITSTVSNPTNAPFTATITFSEDVLNFEMADITLTNATASNFTTTSASVYTALITPTADGTVSIDIAADVANDAATNTNTTATQLSTLYDATKPNAPLIAGIDTYSCAGVTTTTADNTLVFNGTAEANSIVELFINASSVGTTTADASGNWTYDHSSVTLADGTYNARATATDAATNTSDDSTTFSIIIDTKDFDGDGNPDFCDTDDDNDGVLDVDDNSYLPNPDQEDSNNNGIGDVQEDCDNDGILNYYDTENEGCQASIVMKKKYGFSPNGDGVNDTWVIENIALYPNNVVNIYNRSGKLVFSMKGYDNSFNGFSNKTSSSNKLPVGAYYFTVEFNTPGAKPAKGWIYINY